MQLPITLVIPDAKVTEYLLVRKSKSDKSQFLAKAGFTAENPEDLKTALRNQAVSSDAVLDRIDDEYGQFYRVAGDLVGVNGVSLSVVTIWVERRSDSQFHFVTLKPLKEKKK
jgi:hypothetical protein